MRVFFSISTEGNTGPSNANRGFFENWPTQDEVRLLSGKSKLKKLLNAVKGMFWCNVAVSGGPGILWFLIHLVARIRNIPVVGYCHGYAPFENELNGLGLPDKKMRSFVRWLDDLDVVATNSDFQRGFLETRQPTLKGKVKPTLLGVEPFEIPKREVPCAPGHIVVAASGGTRPIKGNDITARAVLLLKERGADIELRVYGRNYSKNPELDKLVESTGLYRGQLRHDEFISELKNADIFVMNSRHETFGLSAVDALAAGCSLLFSTNCGVKEIFKTEEYDVVFNCEDAEEVAKKIAHLVEHPNCERLYSSIDFESCSWVACAGRLRNVCACAIERKRKDDYSQSKA